jgi:methyltransferase-like protein 6
MGLSVASSARQVMGWEIVPEAVRDAKRNAEMNGIANAKFYRVDLARLNASKGAQGLLTTPKGKELPMPDVVITDPARPGMDAKLISILRTIGARRIVYVSCNPATQARDAALLTAESQGAHDVQYALTKCTPVDMFPHTAHVESVAVFDRVGSA